MTHVALALSTIRSLMAACSVRIAITGYPSTTRVEMAAPVTALPAYWSSFLIRFST